MNPEEPASPPPAPDHPERFEEGEERAPAGVRTMAIVRWALVVVMAVVAALSVAYWLGALSPADGVAEGAAVYQCPMHPSVVQDQPGQCPICGMDLVLQTKGPQAGSAASPPTAAESAAAGSHAGHRHEPSDPFACPMHPEETGTQPTDRCPICNMFLTPRAGTEKADGGAASDAGALADAAASAEAGAAPASGIDTDAIQPVPGLVPIELALDRVQLIGVRTAPAVRRPLISELRTVGFVAADESKVARVHTRFSGWIRELVASTTGQKVKRGQVLATLFNLDLLPAQQEFLSARSWAAPPNAGATDQLLRPLAQDARARLELLGMSEAEIVQIEKTGQPVRNIAVHAPISGHVTAKAAVRGAFVQPGTQLFEIADLSKIWVLADVYEYEVGRVAVGQSASVEFVAYPKQRFTGSVEFIYPTLNPTTRTLRVRIVLENQELKLLPGMYGDVFLQVSPAEGLIIPAEALVDTGEDQYVFVALGGGRFEPRAVRVGERADREIQILSGLHAGEQVVTTGNFLLDSESRLRSAIESKP